MPRTPPRCGGCVPSSYWHRAARLPQTVGTLRFQNNSCYVLEKYQQNIINYCFSRKSKKESTSSKYWFLDLNTRFESITASIFCSCYLLILLFPACIFPLKRSNPNFQLLRCKHLNHIYIYLKYINYIKHLQFSKSRPQPHSTRTHWCFDTWMARAP